MAQKQPVLPLQGRGCLPRSCSSPTLSRPQSASLRRSWSGCSTAGHVNAVRGRRRSAQRAAVPSLAAIATTGENAEWASDVATPSPISKVSEALGSPESAKSMLSRRRRSSTGELHSPSAACSPETATFESSSGGGIGTPARARLLSRITYESHARSQGYDENLQPLAAFLRYFVGRAPLAEASAMGLAGAAAGARMPASLKLWVPDTILWEEGSAPTWYYSDKHGCVTRTQNFSLRDIQRRFQRKRIPEEVVAVMKSPVNRVRNRTSLIDSKRLPDVLKSMAAPVVLQRFIRSRGRPSLLRCCWKRDLALEIHHVMNNQGDQSQLADEGSLLVSVHRQPAGSLEVNAVVGKLRTELSEAMDHIVKYLAAQRGLVFDELVCDFIRDETYRSWFLQVKAFSRRPETPHWAVGPGVWSGDPQEPGDRSRCGLCECTFRTCDLRNALNTRQLLKIHERLRRWRGSLSWAQGTSTLISRDATTYQMFHVCDDCYALHCALEDLARTGASFGSFLEAAGHSGSVRDARNEDALGVCSSPEDGSEDDAAASGGKLASIGSRSDTEQAALALSPVTQKAPRADEQVEPASLWRQGRTLPHFALHTRARHEARIYEQTLPPRMPSEWQCPLERLSTQAVVHTKRPGTLQRFRLLLLVHALRGDLDELREVAAEQGLLTLTWSLFGMKRCVALRLDRNPSAQEPACGALPVHALGSQHLFASCAESASEWVSDFPRLAVYLVSVASGQRLACASFDLRHVVKDKVELHSFEAPLRGLGITLWIRATLGFSGGAAFDCERVELNTHIPGRVYVPPSSIAGPEALPSCWLGLLSGVTVPVSMLDVSHQLGVAESRLNAERAPD